MSGFPQPLQGRIVLDLSLLLPGPLATSFLATFGAEVIKVEPPTGDPLRQFSPALYRQLNRDKAVETLDLKTEEGRARLFDLAERADALVEGFRPGVLDRLGVGVDRLRQRQRRLVVTSVSGYGATGPSRDRPAHDLTALAAGGYFSLPADLDDLVARPQFRVADLLAAQTAALATVMAMLEAGRTGRAPTVDTSLFDATAAAALMSLLSRHDPGSPPEAQTQVMADSAIYACADGRWIAIATLEDHYWARFIDIAAPDGHAVRSPRYATRRGRDADKRGLAEGLEALFATRHRDEWLRALGPHRLPVVAVYRDAELLSDPQLVARAAVRRHGRQPDLHFPAFPAVFDGHRDGLPTDGTP